MVYLTGDTHGDFKQVAAFCDKLDTTLHDTLVILGDAGINYTGSSRDYDLKQHLVELPITLLCIHGNHEMRPTSIPSYTEKLWNGGTVYVEPLAENLLFAKDGEVYNLGGKQYIAIGGAYSVDKYIRLSAGYNWFSDEQPSVEIKERVEGVLDAREWCVDVVLSHTCPYKYIPRETFIPGIDQSKVDNSTEQWLDKIESRLSYGSWYCGHYHTSKVIDKLRFMFNDFIEL